MIEEQKRTLTGSKARDKFKQLHKQMVPDNCYALDIDFAFVEKNQNGDQDDPFIAAILDFKKPGDNPTFTEVLAYNQFLSNDIPVFIVESGSEEFEELPPSKHSFTVKKYQGGDWREFPPSYECATVREGITWKRFAKWESELRVNRRQEVREQ